MKAERTIGVLIGNANSPYSIELMHGIRKEAKRHKVNIIYYIAVHNTYAYKKYFGEEISDDYDYQNSIVYNYTEISEVDALIIAYGSLGIFMEKNDLDTFLQNYRNIPYILVGDRDESRYGASIIADNYQGMAAIAEHLAGELGYRNLTYLAGPPGNRDADERNQAVWDIMRKYAIPFDESRIEYGDFSDCVEDEIGRLLERHPDMEAMICANDMMAEKAYQICKEKGLTVGKDIAITGYDDSESAIIMDPPLTTVVQNADDIGRRSLQGILELLDGKEASIIVVPATIKIRQSSFLQYNQDKQADDLKDIAGSILKTNSVLKKSRNSLLTFQQESWFVPLISRDMMSNIQEDHAFFRCAMTKLSALRVNNAALFIFDSPVIHRRDMEWKRPDKLYMVSCLTDGQVQSYNLGDAPFVTAERGISSVWKRDEKSPISIFSLYSEDRQYGFIAMDMDPSNLSLAYLISMQIANALKFYALSNAQKRTQKELERLIQEVREKNEVLGFISEYDQMTNTLNRRGFLERAMKMKQYHSGEKAMLIFADLDYLKEINDNYGHAEGDFAIKRCADVLKMEAGEDGIVGRIGGDEFVVMQISDREDICEDFLSRIKEKNEYFNLARVKPYNIDISMGYHYLVLDDNISMTEILKKADESLYEAKKQRRNRIKF